MKITDIIKRWYNEYVTVTFLTEQEYRELIELLDIITTNSNIVTKWSREEVQEILPCIIPSGAIVCRLREFRGRELKGEQGTTVWLNARMMYITASVSAACAGLMGNSSRENQILEKATWGKYRPFKGGYYTEKGNMFEDVTNNYYSYVNKGKIWAFNLIPHNDPKYEFMGASTDGVSNRLVNIEIKTLVGRSTDDTKFKKEYYHQMQHQMECLQLDETDFIEVKYDEHENLETALTVCKDHISKMGIVLEMWDTKTEKMLYDYAPAGLNIEQLKQWEDRKTTNIGRSTTVLYVRSLYWTMTEYLCRRVQKDPSWIKDMGPKLRQFWDEVLELRSNPAELKRRIAAKNAATNERKRNRNTKNKKYEPAELEKCMI